MAPQISVLTPSFNSGKHLERAIASVISQDFKNWEHIVVDNLSTDNTREILKKYDHIKFISEEDFGQSDAMNKAFNLSTGKYIVYLNADDYFEPGAFSSVINFFEDNPQLHFVTGRLVKTTVDGRFIEYTPKTSLLEILTPTPAKFPLNPVSYFYSRELQEAIGEFPLDNHYTMDYWFLLRAYKKFRIGFLDQVLGYFDFDNNKSQDGERAAASRKIVRDEFLRSNPHIAIKYWLHGIIK